MARATLIGFSAVAMWALLALFTAASGHVPPFMLSAMAFTVGTAVGLVMRFFSRPLPPPLTPPHKGEGDLAALLPSVIRQDLMPSGDAANPPPPCGEGLGVGGDSHAIILSRDAKPTSIPPFVWAIGIAGLFGYHFFYFTALRNAPAVDASLIAYLWPLLIVVGSALMPGERLGWHHVAGTLLGLAGTILIVTKGGSVSFDARYAFGYGAAGACALVWTAYSLLSRRFQEVPTSVVTWFCAATAVLSLACHLLLEETVWPANAGEWLAVAGLGLLPVGAAFYTWDHGVKHGNIQVLGACSYAAPLLSTLILIAAGRAEATPSILAACLLITGGAALAAKTMLFGGKARDARAST